jgi:ubiquinone/menaquinone biosynthesis C-methylase UbiE
MRAEESPYIPALRFHWLTPLYDPLLRWVMREERFKRRLIRQANIQPGFKVLDLGCGTGTLTVLTKQAFPDISLVGIDGDKQVLEIARKKAQQENVLISWDYGLAYALPYPDNIWDRVLSSLMTHHLTTVEKLKTFKEVLRVLKPGGEFHVLDFGRPHTPSMVLAAGVMQHFEHTQDNFEGKLPLLMHNAGFDQVIELSHINTIFGPLSFVRAVKAH